MLPLLALALAKGAMAQVPASEPVQAGIPAATEISPQSERQSTSDAWWTGPLFAPGASTMPPGHFLVEPYFYDRRSRDGDSLGTSHYVLYGLRDGVTVGFLQPFAMGSVRHGVRLAGSGFGDTTPAVQFRLNNPSPGHGTPTVAVVLEETLPTSRYDRLDARHPTGQGAGAFTTTVALYLQEWLWLANGRILRARLDLSRSFSDAVKVHGASVYGTAPDFRGSVRTGAGWNADGAVEYSITRNWVADMEVVVHHSDADRLMPAAGPQRGLGSSDSVAFGPAVEYNWTSNFGVIAGLRLVPRGHNVPSSTTPVIAVNMVF